MLELTVYIDRANNTCQTAGTELMSILFKCKLIICDNFCYTTATLSQLGHFSLLLVQFLVERDFKTQLLHFSILKSFCNNLAILLFQSPVERAFKRQPLLKGTRIRSHLYLG